jgi:hypothetical protein
MTITLDAPLTTDEHEPACGCGETENLRPGPSGDMTCRDCLREWASLPDARFYDFDDFDDFDD